MEELYNSYKNIVNRAVAIGLVSENNKPYYLSAIPAEASTEECKETKNFLNNLPSKNFRRQSHLKQIKQNHRDSEQAGDYQKYNNLNHFPSEKMSPVKIVEAIENLSILNLDNMRKIQMNLFESESDTGNNGKNSAKCNPDANLKISLSQSEVLRKKPKRNEILNFNIPIYMDIQTENSTVNPKTANNKSKPKQRKKTELILLEDKFGGRCKMKPKRLDEVSEREGRILPKPFHYNTGTDSKHSDGKVSTEKYAVNVDDFEVTDGESIRESDYLLDNFSKNDIESSGHRTRVKLPKQTENVCPFTDKRLKEPIQMHSLNKIHLTGTKHLNGNFLNNKQKGSCKMNRNRKLQRQNDSDSYLNINIICQFFPRSRSKRSDMSISEENELEANKFDLKATKGKMHQKKGLHYLSKIFSRTK